MLRLTGRVTNYVEEPWEMNGRTGTVRKVTVMVAEAYLVTVRLDANRPAPQLRDEVDWAVEVREANNRTRLVVAGEWSRAVPEESSAGIPAASYEVPV